MDIFKITAFIRKTVAEVTSEDITKQLPDVAHYHAQVFVDREVVDSDACDTEVIVNGIYPDFTQANTAVAEALAKLNG